MKNLVFLTLVLFSLLLPTQSIAQTKTFSNVLSMSLRNSGPILDNNEVKGYYFFYKQDKVDRKTNAYSLRILDQNLEPVGKKKIVDSKHIYLMEGTFNGESIMLKFFNTKTREITYRNYGTTAKLQSKETLALSKREMNMNAQIARSGQMGQDATKPTTLFAIPGKGFIDYIARKDKKVGFDICFMPSNEGSKKWTFSTDYANSKMNEFGGYLFSNDEILLSGNTKRKKIISTKGVDYFIMANDLKTGEKLWEKPLSDDKFELALMNTYDAGGEGQVVLSGSYFKKGANTIKAKSLGLFSIVMNLKDGSIVKKNFISWVKDAGKFLDINDKGKIKSIGYIYFHKFIKTADGRIFGIGEQYKKAASTAGIIGAALGGGGVSVVKMNIQDFYIFEFNNDFSLKDIKVFPKGKSGVELPSGFEFLSSSTIAMVLKSWGSFDYYFTQQEDDGEVMHICYLDYDRSQKKAEREYFGTITYVDGEFTSDKIVLKKKKKTSINVLPAKPGHVLIMEYNRKEKTMTSRLEAINY